MLCGETSGKSFQQIAHGIELGHLLLIELRDDQTTARGRREHAIRFQAFERIPNRRATHTEPLRDVGLADPLSRSEPSTVDCSAQVRVCELGARRPVARRVTASLLSGWCHGADYRVPAATRLWPV